MSSPSDSDTEADVDRGEPVAVSAHRERPPGRGVAPSFPPELLDRVTPKHVGLIIDAARARDEMDHELRMRREARLEKDQNGARGGWSVAILVCGILMIVAAYQGRWEMIERLGVPIATGVGGFIAGRARRPHGPQ